MRRISGRWIPFLQEMVDGNVGIVRLDAVQLLVKCFPVALRRGCHRSPVSDDGRHRDMQDDQPSPVISGQRTGQVKRVFGKEGKNQSDARSSRDEAWHYRLNEQPVDFGLPVAVTLCNHADSHTVLFSIRPRHRHEIGSTKCILRSDPGKRSAVGRLDGSVTCLIDANDVSTMHSFAVMRGEVAGKGNGMVAEGTDRGSLPPLRFSILAVIVGIVAGLGAVIFRGLIAGFHNSLLLGRFSLEYDANVHTPSSPWGPLVVLVPVIGAVGVAFLVKTFAPEAKGHGVPEVMDAIYYGGAKIRPVVALVKSLASALSIGSGGSVGGEGPIIQIGASFGSTVGQILRLPPWQRITLIAGGAGGGIAATFNTPVGGVLFARRDHDARGQRGLSCPWQSARRRRHTSANCFSVLILRS